MYFTPAAVSYLAQIVFVLTITGFFIYSTLFRPYKGSQTSFRFLLAFFVAVGIFAVLLFFETASLPTQRLQVVYLENTATGLIVLLLVRFAYHFPVSHHKWEARLAASILIGYLLVEAGFALYRFIELQEGIVHYRQDWADYILVVSLLWVPVVFMRQTMIASKQHQLQIETGRVARPGPYGIAYLWRPSGTQARAARAFALVFLIPVGMGLINLLQGYWVIPMAIYHASLSVGLLISLYLFALVYLNFLPQLTSFMVKLVGTSLVTLLAVLGMVSWIIAPAFAASFSIPSLQGQTLQFTPNNNGGYDVTKIPYRFEDDLGLNLVQTDQSDDPDNVAIDFVFPFYDETYNQIYINNDGVIGLGYPVNQRNFQYYYGVHPTIFPLYINLTPRPAQGGTFARQDIDKLVVTWMQSPASESPQTTYTFQLVLHHDGVFTISYQDIPDAVTFEPNASPKDSVWLVGAVPGNTIHRLEALQPPNPGTFNGEPLSSGPEGVVFDYYLAFRRQLNLLFQPLAGLIIVGSLVILIGFPLVFYRNLIAPLNTLLHGVQRIEAGDYTVNVQVKYADEIGILTQTFNKMVSQLGDLIGNLERRVAERTEDLKRAKESAEAGEKAKSTFLANISHELHTPLGLVDAAVSTLLSERLTINEGTRQFALQTIAEETRHLTDMVDNLLAVTRMEQHQMELVRIPVDLADLLQRTVATLQVYVPQRPFLLHNLAESAEIPIDGVRMRLVFTNLLQNAVKYSAENTDITITLTSVGKDVLVVEIKDQGYGINPDDKPHIFERFYRGDLKLTHKIRGTGLGLAICREIVMAHGGRIWAESEPGKGSTFFVLLPRDPQQVSEVQI